tara:strand:+ start:144 stop:395 length:252 start_codon:yes stop_codon:yes gene_type:complete
VVALSETGCGFGVQLLGSHVADDVKIPREHDVCPESVYPSSHVGVHVEPLASVDVQSPTPPFIGATDASQLLAKHDAAVKLPR